MSSLKRLAPVFLLTLLASTSFACMAATRILLGETPTPRPTATPVPFTPTPDTCPDGDCISACVNRLDDIVHSDGMKSSRREFFDGEEYTLVTYGVNGDRIEHPISDDVPSSMKLYQENKLSHQEIWDYFAAIIPNEQRSFVTHYVIYTDGKDNILAAVSQSEQDPEQWDLTVDILDTTDPKELTYTLLHEFGHLLTLNPDQVTPSQAVFAHPDDEDVFMHEQEACSYYFPGEGCSRKKAYINLFYNRFWDDIYDEWIEIDNQMDDDIYEDQLESFYEKYEDQFVSNYASTSPEEDIAESWSYFVLEPKPAVHNDRIADEKIRFFYEFPELIDLREQIARNLCDQLEK